MAKQPKPPAAQQPQVSPQATEAPPAAADSTRRIPQGSGVDPKPFNFGAPPRYVKYNVAVKVLADPVARESFSQPYSGQRRSWKE